MSPDIPGVCWGQNGPSSRADDLDAFCEGPSRAPKWYHSGCSKDVCFHLTQLKRKAGLGISPVCLSGDHRRPHSGQNLAQPRFAQGKTGPPTFSPPRLRSGAHLPGLLPLVRPTSPDPTHPHVAAHGEPALKHPSRPAHPSVSITTKRQHHAGRKGHFPRCYSVWVLS